MRSVEVQVRVTSYRRGKPENLIDNGCVGSVASLSWRSNVGAPERSRVYGSSVEGNIPILLVRRWVGLNLGRSIFYIVGIGVMSILFSQC